MTTVAIIVSLTIWVAVLVAVLALCRAAAQGDRWLAWHQRQRQVHVEDREAA